MTTAVPGRTRRPLSLRAGLLLAFLIPLALVLASVGVIATTALQRQLIGQVDDRLEQTVDRSAHADRDPYEFGPPTADGTTVDDDGDRPGFLFAPGQAAGTLAALVVDGTVVEGGVIGSQGQKRVLTAAQAELVAAVGSNPVGNGEPRTVDLGGSLGDYRVTATATERGAVLISGLPLAETTSLVSSLIAAEIIVGLLGLVAAALAGFLLIRRTLRPLDRVAATATRVAELPLSSGEVRLAERVPPADTDPHTEVGQVGSALNRLLDHVETSLTARQASETQVRQFVADASHELRTPLASIRGYAELVGRHRGELPPDIVHALRRVESEAVRMTGLVDDLLLLARLDAGRDIEAGDVDLTALVVDTVSDAHVAGPDHDWRFDLPDGAVSVPGDDARLHQVLANLLANSRTHTPPGTTTTTRLRLAGDDALVEVSDDGPGIAPDLQEHVFERFARGDSSRSRAAGSTGLGLAIVHAVVSAHGGSVQVRSRPGETVFSVRLPHATLTRSDEPDEDEYRPLDGDVADHDQVARR